jgi:hypothetical protein
MQALGQTAQQLGLPLAVHTGAAEGCKQALRAGARSLDMEPRQLGSMHTSVQKEPPQNYGVNLSLLQCTSLACFLGSEIPIRRPDQWVGDCLRE